jgi:hypothetical protein
LRYPVHYHPADLPDYVSGLAEKHRDRYPDQKIY